MTDIRATAKPGPTFDGESMRAILDGRKSQTRRVLKGPLAQSTDDEMREVIANLKSLGMTLNLPYRVGGVYYARESLCCDDLWVSYRGDGTRVLVDHTATGLVRWPWKCKYTSSFAMPRWAARVFLRVTDVRVQRLGEISEEDAIAEGILPNPVQEGTWMEYPPGSSAAGWRDPRRSFESRWNQVNKPGSWERDRNKWVAAYTFEIIKPEGVRE